MSEIPPLRVREADGSPNLIPVFELVVSGATIQKRSAISALLLIDSGAGASGAPVGSTYVTISLDPTLTAERTLAAGRGLALSDSGANAAVTLYIPTPLDVSSGGTGASTFTNRGIIIGSGANALQVLSALNSGELVVGSSTVIAPQILGAGSQGQILASDSSARLGLVWISSAAIPGAAGLVYAQTENSYIVIGLNTNLTAERNATAGVGIIILDSGANSNVVFNADTNVLVTTGRTISTVYPISGGGNLSLSRTFAVDTAFLVNTGRTLTTGMGLAGGGNLSADRTLVADTAILVTTGRTISTTYPLAGGGNLSADRTFSVDTAFLVNTGRTLTTGMGLAGGGNLSADRTLTADTAVLVTTGRTISTTYPLAGGGDFSANRTHSVDTAFLVNTGRTISTTYPISGGGDFSANRTFAVDTAFLVNTGRTISAGSGLTGGGDLSADRTFSVNTNIRDKASVFFAAGNLSTTMFAEETRIYIPFNMEPRSCYITATTAPTGASIIVQINQWNAGLTASTAIWAAANRPTIPATAFAGSSLTFDFTTLFAGSFLGLQIDQVGSTNAGSNLTVTLISRTS